MFVSRPESRPDFARGFGLDVTEEEEEPPENALDESEVVDLVVDLGIADQDDHVDVELGEELDGASTVAQSRIHSRHVSKISAPLSLRSVGGTDEGSPLGGTSVMHIVPAREPIGEVPIEDLDGDAVAEWTGSEDLRDTTDDEVRSWLFFVPEKSYREPRVSENGLTPRTRRERDRSAFTVA